MVSPKRLDIEPDTMDIEESAARLGISLTTAYEKTQRDALPVPLIRGLGRYRFSRQVYAELMARQHAVSEQTVTWNEPYSKHELSGKRPPERSANLPANQPGDAQDRVLGSNTANDLLRVSQIELNDFVIIRCREQWSTTYNRGSARQALAKAERRRCDAWNPPVIHKRTGHVVPEAGQGRTHFGDEYLTQHGKKRIPADIQSIVGSNSPHVELDEHVFDQMIPGAQHSESTWFVENLDLVLDRWVYRTPSPQATKSQRWEFYTLISTDAKGGEMWYLTVIEERPQAKPALVISGYPMKGTSVQRRRESPERAMLRRGD